MQEKVEIGTDRSILQKEKKMGLFSFTPGRLRLSGT